MKRHIIHILMLAGILLSCERQYDPAAIPQEEITIKDAAVKGELLVKFSPDVAEILESALPTKSGVAQVDDILELAGTYEFQRVFPVDARNEHKTREAGLHLWYIVRFDADQDIETVGRKLAALGQVQGVEYNHTIKKAYNDEAKMIPASSLTKAGAKDPYFAYQWNISNDGTLWNRGFAAGADVNVVPAWEKTTGDPSVIVAVLDEGIFYAHPDLADNMWRNEGEIFGSPADNDGNGYAGDYHGYNFVTESGVISYNHSHDVGHGTHVAGVISARNGNAEGIKSIAGGSENNRGVSIMSCQIFSGNSVASVLAEVRAIKYAADNGAVILQCSWGYVSGAANKFDWPAQYSDDDQWMTDCPIEKDALFYFINTAGSPNGPIEGGIAVFASGNESAAAAGYPGAYGEFVSVIGTAPDFTPAVYTNYGPGCNICAPGGDQDYFYDHESASGEYGTIGCILSTVPYTISESGYGYMEGTSMATPHVSSVLALGISYAKQKHLHLKASQYRELLEKSARRLPEQALSGRKTYYKYVADLGSNHAKQMELGSYRSKMGAGQVDADAFLSAIAGFGVPMQFPNVTLGIGQTKTIDAAQYFDDASELRVSQFDESIVGIEVSGTSLVFTAKTAGSCSANITTASGQRQISIIVRQNTGSEWL